MHSLEADAVLQAHVDESSGEEDGSDNGSDELKRMRLYWDVAPVCVVSGCASLCDIFYDELMLSLTHCLGCSLRRFGVSWKILNL